MGSECSTNSIKEEYEIIREFKHTTLGQIKLIRNIKTYNNNMNPNAHHNGHPNNQHKNAGIFNSENNGKFVIVGDDDGTSGLRDGQIIAVKEFRFPTISERDKYVKVVKQAGCYSKIPTLLRVYSYQISGNKASSAPLQFQNYRCSHSYPISIYFSYYPFTLQEQMRTKRAHLLQHMNLQGNKRYSSGHWHWHALKNIKLNNYSQIDRLPSAERKIVNLYYQEVQILRFIDYVVGALYFLDHLEHPHQALCPENVMIDEEGKYALLDASVFKLKTNYQIAYTELYGQQINDNDTEAKRSALKYLAPQLLSHIKNKHIEHRQSSQKSEVFNIGLIALQMCLIDFNILQENSMLASQDFPIIDKINLRFNKNSVNKALIIAQSRYSLQLVDLLASMLQHDPQKRINFSTLIDTLSPLLVKNLGQIQKLYNPQIQNNIHLQNVGLRQSTSLTDSQNPLFHKLAQLETNYNKIMARTSMLENSITQQSQRSTIDEQFILNDEKRILKQLRKINYISVNAKNKQSLPKNGVENKNEPKREVRGSQLYDLYLSQYETIKKNRLR